MCICVCNPGFTDQSEYNICHGLFYHLNSIQCCLHINWCFNFSFNLFYQLHALHNLPVDSCSTRPLKRTLLSSFHIPVFPSTHVGLFSIAKPSYLMKGIQIRNLLCFSSLLKPRRCIHRRQFFEIHKSSLLWTLPS